MDFTQRIADLVASNPGQMTGEEYSAIVNELQVRGPCAFLVFGLGRDTPLWTDVNRNGRTVFLEHDAGWVARARTAATTVYEVTYKTKVRDVERLKTSHPGELAMILPTQVRDLRWDVILVDSPPGQTPSCPGRFQSIYEASRLAAPDAAVFVHDIDRPVEKWFSTRFLGKSIATVHRLGVFGTQAKLPRR